MQRFLFFAILVSCGDSSSEGLFHQKYNNLCDAYKDITSYAKNIHISSETLDYENLLSLASSNFAKKLSLSIEIPESHGCQDIEAIVQHLNEPSQDIYSGVLKEYMHLLDPHSNYISEKNKQKKLDQNIGRAIGTGIEFRYIPAPIQEVLPIRKLVVDTVYPETPADGVINPGEVLISVNDEEITNKTSDEIREAFAKNDSEVLYHFQNRQEPILFEKTPYKKPAHYFVNIEEKGFVMVRIRRFSKGLSESLKSSLNALESNIRGLIIDLRGNPGGRISEAVGILDLLLLKSGKVFFTSGNQEGLRKKVGQESYSVSGNPIFRGAVAILVDSGSASVSEIIASVLQHQKRGIVLGERTYGKASVQIEEQVSSKNGFGGLLTTTIALVRYDKAPSHQLTGVIPDQTFQNPRFQEAVSLLRIQKPNYIVYESDFPHAILPTELVKRPTNIFPPKQAQRCEAEDYRACLTSKAIAYLKRMENQ